MSITKVDVIGKKFNRLLVLEELSVRRDNKIIYKCQCDCGNTTEVSGTRIKNGRVKSCGCLWMEKISLDTTEASFNALYSEYKVGAEIRNLEFDLSIEQFRNTTSSNCFYCDLEPKQIGKKAVKNGNYFHNGIDRKNNQLGYTAQNSIPCCKMCNIAKSNYSEEQFYTWSNRLYKNLEKKGLV